MQQKHIGLLDQLGRLNGVDCKTKLVKKEIAKMKKQ